MTISEHVPISRRWQDKRMSSGTPATRALDRLNIAYSLHSYEHNPRADSFGEEAANLLGVDPRQIFKTLIVSADGRLVCAVVPVAARLNLKALASTVGAKKAELADPAKAQRATGYVVGGISPIGHRSALPVVLDSSTQDFATVFVSAGKRGLQVELAPAGLSEATAAITAAIATAGG
jgi:Cys-tRNA(Pro)/Cys-tRNA(Cys) deacylase